MQVVIHPRFELKEYPHSALSNTFIELQELRHNVFTHFLFEFP